jgi:hypothetical protein
MSVATTWRARGVPLPFPRSRHGVRCWLPSHQGAGRTSTRLPRSPRKDTDGPRATHPTVRAAVLLSAATLLLAGCGGSLADVDRPGLVRPRTTPTDFCTAVVAAAAAARLVAALVARSDPVARQELGEAAQTARRAYADVLATAPEEVRADVERSVAVADLQLDVLEYAGGDVGALARDAAVRRTLATQDYAVATQRVRDYVTTHCGIDLRRLDG